MVIAVGKPTFWQEADATGSATTSCSEDSVAGPWVDPDLLAALLLLRPGADAVAEDLRTLLDRIRAIAAQLAAADDAPEAWRRGQLEVLALTARLADMVAALRDNLWLLTGALDAPPAPTPTRARAAISTAVQACSGLAPPGVRIDVSSDDAHTCAFDGDRLRRIVATLLWNSLAHTESGAVSVTTAQRDAGALELRVSDTGCGVDAATAAAVSEPGGREHPCRDPRAKLSVGLRHVARLLDACHGSLAVKGVDGDGDGDGDGGGVGCTVTVVLPTAAAACKSTPTVVLPSGIDSLAQVSRTEVEAALEAAEAVNVHRRQRQPASTRRGSDEWPYSPTLGSKASYGSRAVTSRRGSSSASERDDVRSLPGPALHGRRSADAASRRAAAPPDAEVVPWPEAGAWKDLYKPPDTDALREHRIPMQESSTVRKLARMRSEPTPLSPHLIERLGFFQRPPPPPPPTPPSEAPNAPDRRAAVQQTLAPIDEKSRSSFGPPSGSDEHLQQSAVGAAMAAAAAAGHGGDSFEYASHTLLVVDDDDESVSTMSGLLQGQGYLTLQARSGFQALEMFAEAAPKPSCVLVNVTLPDISGLEVCEKVEAMTPGMPVPVIMLSGSANRQEHLRSLSMGALDYIAKPVHADEVLARVESILRFRRADLQRAQIGAKQMTDMLHMVFPKHVCDLAQCGERMVAEALDSAGVLVIDVVDFTSLCGAVPMASVVGSVNRLFCALDKLFAGRGIERLDVVGHTYIAYQVIEPDKLSEESYAQQVINLVQAARAAIRLAASLQVGAGFLPLQVRIGAHVGPALAAVVCTRRPKYCMYGTAVTAATALQRIAAPSSIMCSAEIAKQLLMFEPADSVVQLPSVDIPDVGIVSPFWVRPTPPTAPPAASLSVTSPHGRGRRAHRVAAAGCHADRSTLPSREQMLGVIAQMAAASQSAAPHGASRPGNESFRGTEGSRPPSSSELLELPSDVSGQSNSGKWIPPHVLPPLRSPFPTDFSDEAASGTGHSSSASPPCLPGPPAAFRSPWGSILNSLSSTTMFLPQIDPSMEARSASDPTEPLVSLIGRLPPPTAAAPVAAPARRDSVGRRSPLASSSEASLSSESRQAPTAADRSPFYALAATPHAHGRPLQRRTSTDGRPTLPPAPPRAAAANAQMPPLPPRPAVDRPPPPPARSALGGALARAALVSASPFYASSTAVQPLSWPPQHASSRRTSTDSRSSPTSGSWDGGMGVPMSAAIAAASPFLLPANALFPPLPPPPPPQIAAPLARRASLGGQTLLAAHLERARRGGLLRHTSLPARPGRPATIFERPELHSSSTGDGSSIGDLPSQFGADADAQLQSKLSGSMRSLSFQQRSTPLPPGTHTARAQAPPPPPAAAPPRTAREEPQVTLRPWPSDDPTERPQAPPAPPRPQHDAAPPAALPPPAARPSPPAPDPGDPGDLAETTLRDGMKPSPPPPQPLPHRASLNPSAGASSDGRDAGGPPLWRLLASIGLQYYTPILKRKGLTLEALRAMSISELRGAGIVSLAARSRLFSALRAPPPAPASCPLATIPAAGDAGRRPPDRPQSLDLKRGQPEGDPRPSFPANRTEAQVT